MTGAAGAGRREGGQHIACIQKLLFLLLEDPTLRLDLLVAIQREVHPNTWPPLRGKHRRIQLFGAAKIKTFGTHISRKEAHRGGRQLWYIHVLAHRAGRHAKNIRAWAFWPAPKVPVSRFNTPSLLHGRMLGGHVTHIDAVHFRFALSFSQDSSHHPLN